MSVSRFAVVGCGAIAEAHVTALRATAGVELSGAVDVAPAARARVEQTWGCLAFPSVSELLRATKVDAAIVCTPPALHRAQVEELLAAGVHVLCEKPLATTVDDARAMRGAALRHGRVLMVSSKFRFVDDLEEAARLVAAGAVGRPVYSEVTFCARVPTDGGWNTKPALSGGGVLIDNGPHAVDVLGHVLDSPIARVRAAFSARVLSPEVEDTAEVQLLTEREMLGRIALSWTYFTKDLDYLMVQGTEGGLRVAWTGGFVRPSGEREWRAFGRGYDKRAAFARQLGAFLAWAREGTQPAQATDPVRTMAFIEAAYAAERDGGWRALA